MPGWNLTELWAVVSGKAALIMSQTSLLEMPEQDPGLSCSLTKEGKR